jgi:Ca2+-binding RTX toxin-like protein
MGTASSDEIFGTRFDDEIFGLGGDDLLRGRRGDDSLDGGQGVDEMLGRAGDDFYFAETAGDRARERAGEGIDTVVATISYRLGRNIENLELRERGKNGWGNDLDNNLIANNNAGFFGQDNVLDGGAGADFMSGGYGTDIFYVDNIGDRIELYDTGGADPQVNDGDTVYSSVSFALGDDLDPRSGNDFRGFLNDLILTGSEALNGTGNGVQNRIIGNDAANILSGDRGSDTLRGNGGDDDLYGGASVNLLTGGDGDDDFFIETTLEDQITDFTSSADRIFLSRDRFGEINEGQLDSGAFQTGTSAEDADDRILYDSDTGAVRYDADGTGPESARLFLFVEPGTDLTASDFFSFG